MKKTIVITVAAFMLAMILAASAFASTYLTFSGNCNVRSGPGLGYTILGSVNKGSKLQYKGSTRYDDRGIAWYSVYYGNGIGWVSSVYASMPDGSGENQRPSQDKDDEEDYYYVEATSGNTNVRNGPGLKYSSIGVLHKGEWADYAFDVCLDDRDIAWYAIYWKDDIAWVSSVYTTIYTLSVDSKDDLIGTWSMTELRKKSNEVIEYNIDIISISDSGIAIIDWGDSGRIRGRWDETKKVLTVRGNQAYILHEGLLGGADEYCSAVAVQADEAEGFFFSRIQGSWQMTEYRKDINDDVIQFDVDVISVDNYGNATVDWGDSGRIRGKWDSKTKTLTVHNKQVYILSNGVLGGGNEKYSGVAIRTDD